MTDISTRPTQQSAVEARLARRYRSEARFRAAGLGAIFIAVTILVILVGSIGHQSLPAYTVNELRLNVELSEDLVDPLGDASENSIRAGSFTRVLQNAMREEFPDVSNRRELRELFQLFNSLNAPQLMNEVLEDPNLIGQQHAFRMPLADDLDLYLKGRLVEETSARFNTPLDITSDGRGVLLRAQDPVFTDRLSSLRITIENDITAEQAARDRLVEQQALAQDEEAEDLGVQVSFADRRISALQAQLDGDELTLRDDMPSLIVESRGGFYKLTTVSIDGLAARAEQVVPPLTDANTDRSDWVLRIVETPEARGRASDNQLIWARALVERNIIRTTFNGYFFNNADSREPELAGVRGALFGSILTLIITVILSVPVGVSAAIYLEEFAPKNPITDMIEVNINNLAAVPSIVFGILGLSVFITLFGLPRSAPLTAGVVLSLMTLPTIIIATRAALKAVPPSIRQAAMGVGASSTQTVFHHVLPLAAPGILTGAIIGISRALGETAPLLMIGMVAFIADVPSLSLEGMTEPATVLPVQVFLWYDAAERAFQPRAAAAIMVLLFLIISFNALAIYLRHKFERRW